MAYHPRLPYDTNSSIPEPQHHPSPWAHHHRMSGQEQPPVLRPRSPALIDPESEDSDVSPAEGDFSGFSLPIGIPAPSKSSLENQQMILMRLEELERHENHNIKKHNRLREKRQRMDDKIARKRAKQDDMIKAIMSARGRRDSRIKQRRDREDIAYQRFYEDLEEEESRLRSRLKRLKRGLPMDENTTSSRRQSFNSPTSPMATSYSTIPPPAKRRRTSQPPYQESPQSRPPDMMQHQLPPVDRHPFPYHPHHGPPPPSTPYSNQGHHQPYHPPPLQSPKTNHSHPPPDMGSGSGPGPGPYPPNGYHNSPHAPSAATMPPTSTPNQPPRPTVSTYDTRPPPPASSGFAAVNQPPHSGFAAVNSRHAETPPALNSQLMRDSAHKQSSTPVDETPVRPSMGDEKISSGSGSAANKRTPSTTHPYQMSEAFANRHHHCERTDSINRGIWTWYGHGGTQDRPTAQPTEMYLKCNHDNCGRIDWRTVHGLQCHIVKNHEQPKGTIGSLEKALAAYGVPVRDIEEIEKREGLGSGGTMADPKNVKVRAKIRESGERRDMGGRDTPVSVSGPPHMNKQQRSGNSDSPTTFSNQRIEPEKRPFMLAEHRTDGSVTSPIDVDKPVHNRPPTGFAAVNSGWANVNTKPNPTPPVLNRDMATPDRQAVPSSGEPRSPPAATSFWSGWQPKPLYSSPKPQQPPAEPTFQPTHQPQTPQSSHHTSYAAESAPKVSTMLSLEREKEETKAIITDIAAPVPEAHIAKHDYVDQVTSSNVEVKDTYMEDAPIPTRKIDVPEKGIPQTAKLDEMQKEAENVPELDAKSIEERNDTNSVQAPMEESRAPDASKDKPRITTPARETNVGTKEGEEAKLSPPSPEFSTKRVTSRRESRRASVATASSSKFGTERGKEDDGEAGPSGAATENTVDDDGDTIEVNSTLSRAEQKERERIKEEERNQTPPRRLANGRFTRRSLR